MVAARYVGQYSNGHHPTHDPKRWSTIAATQTTHVTTDMINVNPDTSVIVLSDHLIGRAVRYLVACCLN